MLLLFSYLLKLTWSPHRYMFFQHPSCFKTLYLQKSTEVDTPWIHGSANRNCGSLIHATYSSNIAFDSKQCRNFTSVNFFLRKKASNIDNPYRALIGPKNKSIVFSGDDIFSARVPWSSY